MARFDSSWTGMIRRDKFNHNALYSFFIDRNRVVEGHTDRGHGELAAHHHHPGQVRRADHPRGGPGRRDHRGAETSPPAAHQRPPPRPEACLQRHRSPNPYYLPTEGADYLR
jgi:hypothetical protein